MADWRRQAERRAAREKELDEQSRSREAERARKEALGLYLRIEELTVDDDLKEILHIFADRLGLQD